MATEPERGRSLCSVVIQSSSGIKNRLALELLRCHMDLSGERASLRIQRHHDALGRGVCNALGGSIQPHAWLFKSGTLVPYEFRFVPKDIERIDVKATEDLLRSSTSFLDDLYRVVKSSGFE
jgi:hypothetical protein